MENAQVPWMVVVGSSWASPLYNSSDSEVAELIITVSKRIRIDAAHFLPEYDGPCKNVHGHSWIIEVGVKGPVKKNGMVMDFKDLGKFLDRIEKKFDHTLINDTIKNPTAENIIKYIEKESFDYLELPLEFIRTWETPDSCAEWRAD